MTKLEAKIFKKLIDDNKEMKEDLDYLVEFIGLLNDKIDKLLEK